MDYLIALAAEHAAALRDLCLWVVETVCRRWERDAGGVS